MKPGRFISVWTWCVYGFLLAPFVVILYASFSDATLITIPPSHVGLGSYATILIGGKYMGSLATSLGLAAGATVVSLIAGTGAALIMVRSQSWFTRVALAATMLPVVIPLVILGIALLILVSAVGISLSFPLVILAHGVITIPYVVNAVRASLTKVPPAVEQAALSLGCPPWRTLLTITLPLIGPGLLSGALFSFITSFGETVATVFLMPPGHPTLPVEIFNTLLFNFSPDIAAISALVSVLVFGGMWLVFKLFPDFFMEA